MGITHECDFVPTHPLYYSSDPLLATTVDDDQSDSINNECTSLRGRPVTLTISHIDSHILTQTEIDTVVKTSLRDGISLYTLHESALEDAKPTIILTQSLCNVCAVATSEVENRIAAACKSNSTNNFGNECKIISLEPETLIDVVNTFITIADACGVKKRGIEIATKFWKDVDRIRNAITSSRTSSVVSSSIPPKPRVLFLEWLNPPYDAGHWIPDMIERSGCTSAIIPDNKKTKNKSVQLSWEQIYDSDPDVIIIGCCGFDLHRNVADILTARHMFQPLRAYVDERIYATDGNLYFARPGPALREGIAILARCAYANDKSVVTALDNLPFMPRDGEGWSRVIFPVQKEEEKSMSTKQMDGGIPDVEDLGNEMLIGYSQLHEEACHAKKDVYEDPTTGYRVFTAYAHEKRGRCCGSGCRHCPYNHANVKDKKKKIQQPAFLYEGDDSHDNSFAALSTIPPHSHIKVVFFSGGKDSFLAIRALVRERRRLDSHQLFQLILLTTFDADSRQIAHQEIPIDTVVRQASHLGLPLLGIPLRRGSGELYVSRIETGLETIRKRLPNMECMTLVFGDLHLEHIREWREKEFANNYLLEYPLWQITYETLLDDLEESGVSVTLSAVIVEGLKSGMHFTRELYNDVIRLNHDGFGEAGEFHSIAEVWTVSRAQALGETPTSS